MPAPIKVEHLKACVNMTATYEDGSRKICHIEVDVREVKTFLSSGGMLISIDGVIAQGMEWVSLGDPDKN